MASFLSLWSRVLLSAAHLVVLLNDAILTQSFHNICYIVWRNHCLCSQHSKNSVIDYVVFEKSWRDGLQSSSELESECNLVQIISDSILAHRGTLSSYGWLESTNGWSDWKLCFLISSVDSLGKSCKYVLKNKNSSVMVISLNKKGHKEVADYTGNTLLPLKNFNWLLTGCI